MAVVPRSFDPVSMQVFRNLFSSLAEEMGITLQRASFSANIKMRRDFSCAVFDDQANMLAQAAHIPVHLGAMTTTVKAVLQSLSLNDGDLAIVNDPYQGGTHLPDISLVSSVFLEGRRLGYVTNRAHHSDVGGITPGSMPLSADIYQEGLIIPPVKLLEGGRINHEALRLILRNVRTPEEREGDLLAQIAAQHAGEQRLKEITERYGAEEVRIQSEALLQYSDHMVTALVQGLPDGRWWAEDWLDGDGITDEPLRLAVTVSKIQHSRLEVDFSDSDDQCSGPVNAVRAVTRAALLYVIRVLVAEDIPVNDGALASIDLKTRPGSLVDALPPSAVSAGNVETSQRIVDVLFKAMSQILPERVPAASQGTMNNVSFGGFDGFRGRPFTYYETIGGGTGARPDQGGVSAVHDHMSNTLNTPIEVLEAEYPVRARQYAVRSGSSGRGMYSGGEGVRRDIEFLTPASVSIISERRRLQPYGLGGGQPGQTGSNRIMRGGEVQELPGKVVFEVLPGDVISVQTPGGGGLGEPDPSGE